jgi:hypothetical protein
VVPPLLTFFVVYTLSALVSCSVAAVLGGGDSQKAGILSDTVSWFTSYSALSWTCYAVTHVTHFDDVQLIFWAQRFAACSCYHLIAAKPINRATVLENIQLFCHTNTFVSSARCYRLTTTAEA